MAVEIARFLPRLKQVISGTKSQRVRIPEEQSLFPKDSSLGHPLPNVVSDEEQRLREMAKCDRAFVRQNTID